MAIRRSAFTASIASLLLFVPNLSLAHSTERGLILLLPTELYLIGGALAVLASFILLAIVPASVIQKLFTASPRLFPALPISGTVASLVSFLVLLLLVVAGITGSTDPLVNPLPVFTWTLWWVLFTSIQCLTGDLWKYLNPWSGVARLTRLGLGLKEQYFTLPDKAGYGPAILLFAGFAWFELVDIAPEDPGRLAVVISIYWLVNYAAVLVFGEQDWYQRGEPFSIFFRLIGSLSPFQVTESPAGRREIRLVFPGKKLTELPALPVSGILFVLLTLATVSFDGLSGTFLWLKWAGVNPLEFPGRSAVMGINTIGLAIALGTLAGIYFLCVFLGFRLAAGSVRFMETAGRLVYSIIPISLVFHFAHYLTQLLVNAQYAVLAFNDPFSLDWNALGARDFHITTSFLNQLDMVASIWGLQTITIVAGHVIGIAVAHVIALDMHGQPGKATLSQAFMALLMVTYTLFGLWLLSTPAIG